MARDLTLIGCTRCPLHKSAITVCVAARGPLTAPILIVGAHPGAAEDLEGRTFVGKSGEYLINMLRDAGYAKGEVRLSNAVRCIVQEGQPVTSEYIDACRPYLKDEIAEVKPQAIIALGDVALRSLCKLSGIRKHRGKTLPLHKEFEFACDVWPTYHSAFVAAKVPQLRGTVVADLRRVRDRHRPDDVVEWRWFDGKPVYTDGPIAIDVETYREDGSIGERITQLQVATDTECVVALPHQPLRFYGNPIVTHNGWEFDIGKMALDGCAVPYGRDTMVLGYLCDETQPLGLESLCVKYLGVKGWKEGKNARLGTDEFALYGARDAVFTLRLYHVLLKELGERVRIADEIVLPMRLAANDMTKRGIYLDAQAIEAERGPVSGSVEQRLAELRSIVGSNDFNPRSPDQVGAYLKAQGESLPSTPTGKAGTGKKAIARLRGTKFVDALEAFRAADKLRSTYILPYAKMAASDDGRAHPPYTVLRGEDGKGTVTMRTSSWIHTLPRKYKHFFGAEPGRCYVSADYSAIEFRVAGWCAQEPTILENYRNNPGWDPHTFLASRIFELDEGAVNELQRDIGKKGNFGLIYVGSPNALITSAIGEGINLPRSMANLIHKTFHLTYRFTPWHNAVGGELRLQGYVETAIGFRRHYGDAKTLRGEAWNAAVREVVNLKVQNLSYAIAALGTRRCHEEGLPINYFGHDAIGFDFASESEATAAGPLIQRLLCEEPVRLLREKFGVTFDVPLQVKMKYTVGRESSVIA